ncbi:MAG: hypothetical protein OEU52_11420, partial [Xanthomonadales bacterium]|nr:hypothetical protein [Xanthomonadales bacterium]
AVFDEAWLKSPRPIDFERVHIPPEDTGVLGSHWRTRFGFDFLLPDPDRPTWSVRALNTM